MHLLPDTSITTACMLETSQRTWPHRFELIGVSSERCVFIFTKDVHKYNCFLLCPDRSEIGGIAGLFVAAYPRYRDNSLYKLVNLCDFVIRDVIDPRPFERLVAFLLLNRALRRLRYRASLQEISYRLTQQICAYVARGAKSTSLCSNSFSIFFARLHGKCEAGRIFYSRHFQKLWTWLIVKGNTKHWSWTILGHLFWV